MLLQGRGQVKRFGGDWLTLEDLNVLSSHMICLLCTCVELLPSADIVKLRANPLTWCPTGPFTTELDPNILGVRQLNFRQLDNAFAALVDDGARFTRDVLPELLALRHAEDLPLRIVHQDGSVIEASLTASTVTGFSGEIEEVVIVARDLRESQQNLYLREEIKTQHNFDEIVGESLAIKNVLQAIETVAGTHASVLIAGETGTGKELVARAVHNMSTRKDKPLIKVNSASIPRELFESEFFGHVKGAFTGALKDRVGRFELAHKGTLFLDEVSEIPLEMQSKLLRVLQEGEFERVGEERTRRVDVRIVAATNRDLKREVELGRFRQDLYYRLNVFPIEVAPLRHRTEDISLLASQFVRRAARKLNRPDPNLTQAGVLQLLSYDWPGNVREL